MDNSEPVTQPENMSPWVGYSLTMAMFVVPAILLGVICLRYGNGNTAIAAVILWLGFLTSRSLRIVRKSTFWVVERYGKFWTVKFAGLTLVIPLLDSVVFRGSFQQQSIDLYVLPDGKRSHIDFPDGSSPIIATGWYQVGDPKALEKGARRQLTAHIIRYVYRMDASKIVPFVTDVFQSIFRSELERHPTGVAQNRLPELIEAALVGIRAVLAEIGMYGNTILSSGLDLTDAQRAYRDQEIRGLAHAKEMIGRAPSYYEPLLAMIERYKKAGISLSPQEILKLFLDQKALESLERMGANVTFVAPGIDGILKTLPVGGSPAPTQGTTS